MLTWRPANLGPGGNTKHSALLHDPPNRMEITGDKPDMMKGFINNSLEIVQR